MENNTPASNHLTVPQFDFKNPLSESVSVQPYTGSFPLAFLQCAWLKHAAPQPIAESPLQPMDHGDSSRLRWTHKPLFFLPHSHTHSPCPARNNSPCVKWNQWSLPGAVDPTQHTPSSSWACKGIQSIDYSGQNREWGQHSGSPSGCSWASAKSRLRAFHNLVKSIEKIQSRLSLQSQFLRGLIGVHVKFRALFRTVSSVSLLGEMYTFHPLEAMSRLES